MQTLMSGQVIPREETIPIEWMVPDTVAALQAELAQPDAPRMDSMTVLLLSQPAIHMPLHVPISAVDLPEGTSIVQSSDVQMSYYKITETPPLTATVAAAEQVDLSKWPAPSRRPTTATSALALERATRQDPQPRMPEVVIDDGFGV